MSTPNPLVPQGSLLEQQAKSKSTVQVAAFIVAIHVVILGGLLFLGCTKEKKQPETSPTDVLANPPPITGGTNAGTAPDPFAVPTNAVVVPPETNTAPPVTQVPVEPLVTPPAAQSGAGSTSEYTVQKGDVAYKVAKKHGVTLKQLQAANPGVDLAKLKVNQKIQMPAAAAPSVDATTHTAHTAHTAHAAKAPPASGVGDANTYTVKGGDNLSRLAKKYGTSVKAIREANGLTSNDIKVGQHLKIPAKGAAETPTSPEATSPSSAPGGASSSPIVTPGQPVKP